MNPYLSNQLSNAISLPIIALNALAVHDAITSARAYYKLNPPAVEAKKEEQTPKRRTRRLVSFVLCMIVFISLEIYAGWNADAETIDFVGAWFNGVFTFIGLTTITTALLHLAPVSIQFNPDKPRFPFKMDRAKRGVLFILGAVSFLLTIYVNGFAFSFLNFPPRAKEALWVLAKAGILFFMSRYSVGKTVKLRAVLAALVAYEAVVIATSAAVIYFTSSSSPIVFLQDADVSPAATPSPTTSVSFSYILPSVYFTAFAVLVRITSRLDYELSSSSPAVLLTSEPPFPVVHIFKKITSLRPKYSAMVAAVVIGVPAFLMNCAIPCLEKKNPSFASLKDEQMFMLLSFFTIVPVVTVALTLLAAVRGEIATVFSYEEKWALVEEQKAVEEDVDVERADEKN